ncbi:MAG TPA: TrkH family potassium uptake protein [Methanomassiliicoccales archaeon]|nr:TrkH family potassium uptake protein [Methanomassiliicoccales archaeon]HNX48341.1 TrkH family potassium uptake protein [Methanomassiliicoccales archaeon]HPR99117.1 TrkH family potassium uptake protein [Methanomassiliicoccales archaeon]
MSTSYNKARRWFGQLAYYFDRLNVDVNSIFDKVARKESAIPHIFGVLMLYMAIALVFPYAVALYYGEDPRPWIFPILLCLISGILLLMRYRSPENTRPTEAMFVVATGWLALTVMGAIPFVLYGMGVVDAVFEAMSGFTTTGSSIMTNIESWPKSILFWRSFSHWLGGAGIIMIFVTVLPMLGVGGRNLFKNEFPGLDVQNFSARIQEEARKFHYIYGFLSLMMLVLLLFTGIGVFDSFCVMFSTMGTGGLSPHSDSIAYYASSNVEWIVIIFMFLASTNFYLHFQAITTRDPNRYFRNSEFRLYLGIILAATAIITVFMWGKEFTDIEQGVRTSMFQVVSLMSSTGFSTANYIFWDQAVVFLLLALIIIGGSTGSTAGGIKVARFFLTREFIASALHKTIHPRSIFTVKIDGRPLSQEALSSVVAMVLCYFATAIVAVVALILLGIDPTTSISAAIATLSNAGPGLGSIGPYGSYGGLPDAAKLVLTFTMWAGRLEFISVLVLFTPVFWKELMRYREKYV